MAKLLKYYDDPDTTETQKFIEYFDRFFDCLNTRHLREGIQKIKEDLHPYYEPTDKRLEVRTCMHTS